MVKTGVNKTMKFLTWLDVRRKIAKETRYGTKYPQGVFQINCYVDSLEIYVTDEEYINSTIENLKEWFGDWFKTNDNQESFIVLDLKDTNNNDVEITVEFIIEEPFDETPLKLRPLWHEVGYLIDNNLSNSDSFNNIPELSLAKPEIIAFYSFKGGVGRTLSLTAYLFSLIEKAHKNNQELKTLVIDADLEAPGLTYWYESEKKSPTTCFIELLEVYQYSSGTKENAINYIADELRKTPLREGKTITYFLPAFLNQEQLLDIKIVPENITRNLNGDWEYSQLIHQLGQALNVDYIFIDLRAGLSELSSPILLDPRIQRFIVTTLNYQSIKGTELVLKIINNIKPSVSNSEQYPYPFIIINMLTDELKGSSSFQEFSTLLLEAYSFYSEDNDLWKTIIQESNFASEFLSIRSWNDARNKLTLTIINQQAQQWAKEQLEILYSNNNQEKFKLEDVKKLKDTCNQYIYAEKIEAEDLLITESLQNLADNFQNSLPCVVSIGAKGSGKTFNYIQLAKRGFWEKFLMTVNPEIKKENQTYIFPLFESQLDQSAIEITQNARDNFVNQLQKLNQSEIKSFNPEQTTLEIKDLISKEEWSEKQWTNFWLKLFAEVLGLNTEEINLTVINQFLTEKSLKVVFLIDGLEKIFENIETNDQQKIALKSLIENIPNQIMRLRNSHIGIILFLRKDFVRHTLKQNVQQFEDIYKSYELKWDQESFIKLVYWLCVKANILSFKKSDIENMNINQLKDNLEKLWGKKLGSNQSKEAHSISWIFAALTDFNGNLQARDIVRFFYHAAKFTQKNSAKFDKWSETRLLTPQAIRKAIKPCSQEKIKEIKEEYSLFKKWVDEILPKIDKNKLQIPFDLNEFNWELDIINVLKSMGVIYEDNDKSEAERFYIPEIFREGLNFSGTVARPKVVALKRKILGSDII